MNMKHQIELTIGRRLEIIRDKNLSKLARRPVIQRKRIRYIKPGSYGDTLSPQDDCQEE